MATQPDLLAPEPPAASAPPAPEAAPAAAPPDLFPPPSGAQLVAIAMGPAAAAFAARRLDQLLKQGHSLAADLEQPLDHLIRQAQPRMSAALDLLGRADRLPEAMVKIEIIGALLLAAHDRVRAEMARKEAQA
jgi:hypothetical protein